MVTEKSYGQKTKNFPQFSEKWQFGQNGIFLSLKLPLKTYSE